MTFLFPTILSKEIYQVTCCKLKNIDPQLTAENFRLKRFCDLFLVLWSPRSVLSFDLQINEAIPVCEQIFSRLDKVGQLFHILLGPPDSCMAVLVSGDATVCSLWRELEKKQTFDHRARVVKPLFLFAGRLLHSNSTLAAAGLGPWCRVQVLFLLPGGGCGASSPKLSDVPVTMPPESAVGRRRRLRPLPWPPATALLGMLSQAVQAQKALRAAQEGVTRAEEALGVEAAARHQIEKDASTAAHAAALRELRMRAAVAEAERKCNAAVAALEEERQARQKSERTAAAAAAAAAVVESQIRASLAAAERRAAAAAFALQAEVKARRRAEEHAIAASEMASGRERLLVAALGDATRNAAKAAAALEVEASARQRVDALRSTLADLHSSLAESFGPGPGRAVDVGWRKAEKRWAQALANPSGTREVSCTALTEDRERA